MKVFYINLDERTDRKEYMEKMLSNLNLKYERFSAVKASPDVIKTEYNEFYENCVPRFKKYINSKNEGVIKKLMKKIGMLLGLLIIFSVGFANNLEIPDADKSFIIEQTDFSMYF